MKIQHVLPEILQKSVTDGRTNAGTNEQTEIGNKKGNVEYVKETTALQENVVRSPKDLQ